MNMEHVTRYGKYLVYFGVGWTLLWAYNNQSFTKIEGKEMEPTVKNDSLRWTAPKIRTADQLKHEDIVAYTYVQAGRQQKSFAARVIGLPGDRVKISKGEVFVNGAKMRDDMVHVNQKTQDDYEEIIVPKDTVFVLGDGRRSALLFDSRTIGPLGTWAITGKLR